MVLLDPNSNFQALSDHVGLDNRLKKAIARLGHARPTLVQAKCLPLALCDGRDLVVRAQTGSGKTLAYLLPLLQKILAGGDKHVVRAIVLVPTRELCAQVAATLKTLTYYCSEINTSVLSVGRTRGEKSEKEILQQEAGLRDRPTIVVASPRGLLMHIRSGALNLSHVDSVVVDEADLTLSFGYSKDIAEISKALPRIYQGFLMSATLSPSLEALKKIVLHSPVTVNLEQQDESKTTRLKQFYLPLLKQDKHMVLYTLLKLGLLKGKGLIFVNSINSAFHLQLFLEKFHIPAAVLNDELPLLSRSNTVEQFNVGSFDYLIATDSSCSNPQSTSGVHQSTEGVRHKTRDDEYSVARGVDFLRVSFVINFDFPLSNESYVHRIGRTARGGINGVALSFVETKSADEWAMLHSIQAVQPTIQRTPSFTDLHMPSVEQAVPKEQEMPQPSLLDFDLKQIEGFRYRVQDVQRSITKSAIREARAEELQNEIIQSERLQNRIDASDRVQLQKRSARNTLDHLKHVPTYLLPRGMEVASIRKRQKKRRRPNKKESTSTDPLQNLDSEERSNEHDYTASFFDEEEPSEMHPEKNVTESSSTGASWKKQQKKGSYRKSR